MGQALSTGRAGGQHMDESTVARQSSSKVLAAAHEHHVAKDEGLAASWLQVQICQSERNTSSLTSEPFPTCAKELLRFDIVRTRCTTLHEEGEDGRGGAAGEWQARCGALATRNDEMQI